MPILGPPDSSHRLIKTFFVQVASLQQKIVAEDKAVEARTLEFLTEWERNKPTDGSTRPEDALARLQAMETRYTRLKDERDNVAKAKEALELHDTGLICLKYNTIGLRSLIY